MSDFLSLHSLFANFTKKNPLNQSVVFFFYNIDDNLEEGIKLNSPSVPTSAEWPALHAAPARPNTPRPASCRRRRPSGQHVSRSTRTISRSSTQTGAKRMRGVSRVINWPIYKTQNTCAIAAAGAPRRRRLLRSLGAVRKSNSC